MVGVGTFQKLATRRVLWGLDFGTSVGMPVNCWSETDSI